jgi:3-oxoacyl-(acyl-carrier-protein) synthase
VQNDKIYITSYASVSALGTTSEEIWENYLKGRALFSVEEFQQEKIFVSQLNTEGKHLVENLKQENPKYEHLDASVLYAIISARKTVGNLDLKDADFGINIGSSRGATSLFEKYHRQYLEEGATSALASPTTTLGNISSWVLQDLGTQGPEISHSVTCSTALHGMLNAAAWLKSGMAESFLVGGSEAALTPFTIAQMKAVKLYANYDIEEVWPNKSLDFNKSSNTMILGDAASNFFLQRNSTNAIAEVLGLGYASEQLVHNISLSKDAQCLQKSMKMALKNANLESVDVVIAHAPGTKKGDLAEMNAIKAVFKNELPLITSNKFLIGHTFGASGGISLEMAILMLQHQKFVENPFYQNRSSSTKKISTVMVNAVGFGGNAVSVIVGV